MFLRRIRRQARLSFFGLSSALVVAACATAKAGPPPDGLEPGGTVINRDRIEGMNVRTALEVIERSGSHLLIQREKAGEVPRITHRGRDSLLLAGDVQVVIDGVPVNQGVRALENLPAASVDWIQILSGREAVLRYGSTGGNGVIVVKTSAG